MNETNHDIDIVKVGRFSLLSVKIPEHNSLNARLRDNILHMSETIPDTVSNLKSGTSFFLNKWLSKSDLHLRDDPDFGYVADFTRNMASQLIPIAKRKPELAVTSMWCMVSKAGLKGRRHDHKGLVSAAYYVDPGSSSPENGGEILFFGAPGKNKAPTHSFTPEAGRLLLFPSSLYHAVNEYRDTKPRIVISINVN